MDSVHNHGTRIAEAGLFVPRANSTAAKNMFAYEGAVLYNGLPMVLKSADNFIDVTAIATLKTCTTSPVSGNLALEHLRYEAILL